MFDPLTGRGLGAQTRNGALRLIGATLCLAMTSLGCSGQMALAQPLFFSSVTSNDIDYIRATDPGTFACVPFLDRDRREMPDKRSAQLFANDVFVFEARFRDGTRVPIWAHPDFATVKTAEQTVRPVAEALGRLPGFMRAKLSHIVVHQGDETAFAEDKGRFFTVYSDNVVKRLRSHDLEETLFHESVHATMDHPHARSDDWQAAQDADGFFLTGYAAQRPEREDMAETALLAYTFIHHPARLPENVRTTIKKRTPHRLAFLTALFGRLDAPLPSQEDQSLCP